MEEKSFEPVTYRCKVYKTDGSTHFRENTFTDDLLGTHLTQELEYAYYLSKASLVEKVDLYKESKLIATFYH